MYSMSSGVNLVSSSLLMPSRCSLHSGFVNALNANRDTPSMTSALNSSGVLQWLRLIDEDGFLPRERVVRRPRLLLRHVVHQLRVIAFVENVVHLANVVLPVVGSLSADDELLNRALSP